MAAVGRRHWLGSLCVLFLSRGAVCRRVVVRTIKGCAGVALSASPFKEGLEFGVVREVVGDG